MTGRIDARFAKLRGEGRAGLVTFLTAGDPDLATRQQADYADIVAFIESIRDPRLLKLCSAFLERHGERFRRTGAARRNYHARRGGLGLVLALAGREAGHRVIPA